MSLYLLDTDVVVDILARAEPSTRYVRALSSAGHMLLVTAVTFAEVFAGTEPSARASVATTLAGFQSVDITAAMGRKAGEYRYDFARRGQALSMPDTLIAAAA